MGGVDSLVVTRKARLWPRLLSVPAGALVRAESRRVRFVPLAAEFERGGMASNRAAKGVSNCLTAYLVV